MKRLFVCALAAAGAWSAELRIEPRDRVLSGEGAAQQFLLLDGERDLTANARWQVSDASIAVVTPGGRLQARKDGVVTLTADAGSGSTVTRVRIEGIGQRREFQFGRDIGTILTRKGCNGANCHGGVKGRGGLKLSAGALYPEDDYDWIVKGGAYQVLSAEIKGPRVPRIDLKEPEKSLILQKATGTIPHGGGSRFPAGSSEHSALLKWIRGGAPYGPAQSRENRVERLEVFPKTVTLERGGQHRLLVTAHLADGRQEDFTDQALYVSNDREIAQASDEGLVRAGKLGETAILIRAAGHAASATVGVIGDAAASFPDAPAFNFIDGFVLDKLRRFRIPPSPLTSDSEFLRRVCLDLTGTLPPAGRVREFLASADPGKREELIDTLIASPEFVDYWTYRFDDIFRVAVFSNGIVLKWSQMYAEWVRDAIARNKPYDRIARERLTAQGYDGPTRHYLPYNVIGPPGETMAEEVRVFFGRRLDCAQCHNHPYETWSQDQYWGLAAFFGRLFKMGDTGTEYVIFDHPLDEPMSNGDVNGSVKLLHPRSKVELKPTLLDGTRVEATGRENPREAFARWMVSHPYFAEAAVNRIWGYLMGRGIVEPVDDFRSTNPPTHPELLERLAREFRENGHDLRHLIRTIVRSRTYQLSGRPTEANRGDRTNYSHSLARPLDAEVLLDAIADVTGVPETFSTGITANAKNSGQAPAGTRAVTLRQPDLFYSRFLELYGRPNRLSLPERNGKANLGQALNMMAGPVYNEKLSAPESRLQRLIRSGKSDSEIVEELYLASYSRPPEAAERTRLEGLIRSASDREAALKDFVWAILCSREFAENH